MAIDLLENKMDIDQRSALLFSDHGKRNFKSCTFNVVALCLFIKSSVNVQKKGGARNFGTTNDNRGTSG
jgi:hypothetical protein